MATELPPVTVATPAAQSTITTTTIRRRPWKLLALNIANGIVATVLVVLAYLQTINLSAILSPRDALLWGVGINVANIVIRQWFSPPQEIETRVEPTGGQG